MLSYFFFEIIQLLSIKHPLQLFILIHTQVLTVPVLYPVFAYTLAFHKVMLFSDVFTVNPLVMFRHKNVPQNQTC